jgi:glycosyltransferase involved in cell wall biosynthesis
VPAPPPLVSVVVPVWDGERFLGECLEGLAAQEHPALEVVVVDDGSTDGSAGLAESFAERLDRLQVLRRPHEGLAPTRNAGVAAATGPLVAFCDADDVWHPEKAAVQVAHLAEHPSCDVVLCRNETIFEQGVEPPAWLRRDQVRGDLDGVSSASGIYRRAVFDVVRFRPELGIGADFDILVQARAAGFRLEVLEVPLWDRRIHGSSMMDREGSTGAEAEMMQSVRDLARRRRAQR